MVHHKNTLKRFCVSLGVGGKEKYGKTYECFKERQQQELYYCENIIFFFPTSNFLRKHGTKIYLYFLKMHISGVPNFCKSFAFGQFCIKSDCPCRCISHFLSVERCFSIASLSSVHFDPWYPYDTMQ